MKYLKIKPAMALGMMQVIASVANAAGWPPINIVDNDSPIGTILWEAPVDILMPEVDKNKFTTTAILELRGAAVKPENPLGSGIYELLNENGVGSGLSVAAIGQWQVQHSQSASIVCSNTKSTYLDQSGVGNTGRVALIGCSVSNSDKTNNPKAIFTGRVVLVKTSKNLVLDGVRLGGVGVSLSDGNNWTEGGFSLGDGGSDVNPIRRCVVRLDNSNVEFGTINPSPDYTGELAQRTTVFSAVCEGSANAPESTVSVKIVPTYPVTDDTRAIGVQFNQVTSNSLVVRAFSQYSQNMTCDSAEAIEMNITTTFEEIPSGEYVTRATPMHWRLCKKLPQALPSGKFTGSATLIFNID